MRRYFNEFANCLNCTVLLYARIDDALSLGPHAPKRFPQGEKENLPSGQCHPGQDPLNTKSDEFANIRTVQSNFFL
jgi:hypothetical protein